MRDPVITPSGITYDRKDIEEHLQVRNQERRFLVLCHATMQLIADWCTSNFLCAYRINFEKRFVPVERGNIMNMKSYCIFSAT